MVNNTTLPRSNTGLGNCYLIMLNDPDVVNSLKHIFGEKTVLVKIFPENNKTGTTIKKNWYPTNISTGKNNEKASDES